MTMHERLNTTGQHRQRQNRFVLYTDTGIRCFGRDIVIAVAKWAVHNDWAIDVRPQSGREFIVHAEADAVTELHDHLKLNVAVDEIALREIYKGNTPSTVNEGFLIDELWANNCVPEQGAQIASDWGTDSTRFEVYDRRDDTHIDNYRIEIDRSASGRLMRRIVNERTGEASNWKEAN